VVFGIAGDVQLKPVLQFVQKSDQLEVGFNAHPDIRVGELFSNTDAVLLVGDVRLERLHVVLAVGVLDVAEQLGPFSGQVVASSEQIPCGSHLGRVDVGHGESTAAHESGDLAGIDAIVLGLPSVYGFHV